MLSPGLSERAFLARLGASMGKNKLLHTKTATRRIKLTVQYDGTNFAQGWQRSRNHRTVEETLSAALRQVIHADRPLELDACSRTDSGVHAKSQVVVLDTATALPPLGLMQLVSCKLPEDILITGAVEVDSLFDVRAVEYKTYRYTFLLQPDVHEGRFGWYLGHKKASEVDLTSMEQAASAFEGEHDFSAYTTRQAILEQKKSPTRKILKSQIRVRSGEHVTRIEYDVSSPGFLYHQVRHMAGMVAEIGLQRRPLEDLHKSLKPDPENPRKFSPNIFAPAKGLCLIDVKFREKRQGEQL